ncbi:MAG: pyridoxamine 5'-phosphate oxidase, partial [Acidimicrobiia bacterium]
MTVNLEDLSRLAHQQRPESLVVVSATRADGSVQASLVNAGALEHPGDGAPVVGIVVRGNALKLRLLRRRPTATVTVSHG